MMELYCPSGFHSGQPACNLWFQLGTLASIFVPLAIMMWFFGFFPSVQGKGVSKRTTCIRAVGILSSFEILAWAQEEMVERIPVRLMVSVQASTSSRYLSKCLILVHPSRLQSLQIGQPIQVYYDPQDPKMIAVDDLE